MIWTHIHVEDLPVGHAHYDSETLSPMPTWKISGVLNELINQAGIHSSYTLEVPRDAGTARPSNLDAMGHKVNRRGTLIHNAQGPKPYVLGNTVTGAECPACRNARGPSGETAEDVVTTLARRGQGALG